MSGLLRQGANAQLKLSALLLHMSLHFTKLPKRIVSTFVGFQFIIESGCQTELQICCSQSRMYHRSHFNCPRRHEKCEGVGARFRCFPRRVRRGVRSGSGGSPMFRQCERFRFDPHWEPCLAGQ